MLFQELLMATSPITKPLENIETKHIRIIGVPLDLGQSRRGVDMGPSAMRVAGLEAKLCLLYTSQAQRRERSA